MNKHIKLDLQMFADGAAVSAPASDAGTASGEGVQAAAAQPERAFSREERTKAALERQDKFLKGDQAAADAPQPVKQEAAETPQVIPFKDRLKADPALEKDAKEWASEIVKERLKNSKQAESQLQALSPAIERLAQKYGVDPADQNALTQAILNDNDHYEQEALEKGLPVETVKELDRMKREAETLKAQQRQQEIEQRLSQQFDRYAQEMPEVQKLFPGFDISKELNHEDEEVRKKFVFSIGPESPLSLEDAYWAIHHKDIMAAGMKYADEKGAQKVARSIQANARRPSENGLGNVGPSQTQPRPLSQMTQAEKSKRLQEIRDYVKEHGTLDTI